MHPYITLAVLFPMKAIQLEWKPLLSYRYSTFNSCTLLTTCFQLIKTESMEQNRIRSWNKIIKLNSVLSDSYYKRNVKSIWSCTWLFIPILHLRGGRPRVSFTMLSMVVNFMEMEAHVIVFIHKECASACWHFCRIFSTVSLCLLDYLPKLFLSV